MELVPLLEVLVAFLMRWCARRAADPAALDGDFLNLLFALQGFPLSSLSLLRKILRLTRAPITWPATAAMSASWPCCFPAFICTFCGQ